MAAVLLVSALAFAGAAPVGAAGTGDEVPVLRARSGTALPGKYIVTVREGTDPAEVASRHLVTGTQIWRDAVNGFAGELTASDLEKLRRDPSVESIQEDAIDEALAGSQFDPPNWGLDRIDQRSSLWSTFFPAYNYNATAANVHVYVVDSGIAFDHPEFGGRADAVWDSEGGNGYDCQGHGTHVAGIIGSASYGVAKQARLHSVRTTVGCTGNMQMSTVIAAVNWLRTHVQRPAVVNMSLRMPGVVPALNAAVRSLSLSNVFVAVAAGNDGQDACNVSPASAGEHVVTVAASDKLDRHAVFTSGESSNFGPCVDLYAPGHGIESTTPGSNHASFSGTSMAAPHVAGAAALYKSFGDASSGSIQTWLEANSTKNKIVNPPAGTPNRLLYIDPAFSRSPSSTTADPKASIEYAYASVTHHQANPTIFQVLQYSSAGGISTVARTGVGQYKVRLSNLGSVKPGPNGRGGIAHVTANGSTSNWCRLNDWYPEGLHQTVTVACYNVWGILADENFSVLFTMRTNALTSTFGYAWASQPAAASYTAHTDWSYNSQGRENVISRNSVGNYSVYFRGLGVSRGFAHATAVGDHITCQVPNWGIAGADERVDVACNNGDGDPTDARFAVTFYDTATLLGQVAPKAAAVWAGSPTTPSYDPPWSFNSTGGTNHVNRTGTGQYEVFVPAPWGTDEGSAHANASQPWGTGDVRCKTMPAAIQAKLYVRCYNINGVPTDAQFTLHWATHAQ